MFAFYTLRNRKLWLYFCNLFYLLLEHRHNLLTGPQIFSNKNIIPTMVLPQVTLFIISLAPHSAQLTVKLGRISFYLDEKARTLRYFKESYESSHHRRVIENKLDGKSYRAWFEDPNLVHFIQKDYFSCSTKEGFQFLDDVRFLESYRGSLWKLCQSVVHLKALLSRCPILNHQKMIFHWFGLIITILGKLNMSVRLNFQAKKRLKKWILVFASLGELLKGSSMFTKIRKMRFIFIVSRPRHRKLSTTWQTSSRNLVRNIFVKCLHGAGIVF